MPTRHIPNGVSIVEKMGAKPPMENKGNSFALLTAKSGLGLHPRDSLICRTVGGFVRSQMRS